jgi:putative membrane protein
MTRAHQRWFAVLGTTYVVLWTALAIQPSDRSVWALENLLTVAGGIVLFVTRRSFPFSRLSLALLFAYLVLHAVGAHYTYAKVPYDSLFERLTGRSLDAALGFERNQYDRLVHFSFGLLAAYPAREIFLRIAGVRGFWGYSLPFLLMVGASAIFELFEWLAALLFGEGLGMTYLGTQGDEWDAQKDVALATLGAAIAMTLTAAANRRLRRDFAREWAESLQVKVRTPLGEDARRPGI